ncbi:hypothetical protein FDI14_gp052 [Mycobacterium phage SirDuracell]|uniref:Uncharacterized protein n=24 Tax=Viruses TaxID=10239 RepID=Q857V8_9CAUD|nr:gp54 [Mycobacterium phage Cjw1]YP_002014373.1 hypothetical protein Porky_52 [Mycobacterium phage Porky]YP_002014522.1 hypothetical protein Kostya_54 [Mycobacterium phage Kostya]YP_008051534.1 hypothetical protein PBI_MURPHY_55 [Mycobacterium phage Murphy]YP_008051678.1 hypothetical protein PBI_DUMBO_53 [Mycobacterium phage Dumbo]YP_008051987.1 hypothetical protein PBI_PHRUX_51 [Mycobacterium phage Phrux]YP_008052229.1 hypothetical protein M039_gp055 [Mycobacterium phage Phaux]YP_008409446
MTPEDLARRATIASHASWGKTVDRTARTAPARAKFEQRFLDQAGGDPQRAASLRKEYFARLNDKSIRARRRRVNSPARP